MLKTPAVGDDVYRNYASCTVIIPSAFEPEKPPMVFKEIPFQRRQEKIFAGVISVF